MAVPTSPNQNLSHLRLFISQLHLQMAGAKSTGPRERQENRGRAEDHLATPSLAQGGQLQDGGLVAGAGGQGKKQEDEQEKQVEEQVDHSWQVLLLGRDPPPPSLSLGGTWPPSHWLAVGGKVCAASYCVSSLSTCAGWTRTRCTPLPPPPHLLLSLTMLMLLLSVLPTWTSQKQQPALQLHT